MLAKLIKRKKSQSPKEKYIKLLKTFKQVWKEREGLITRNQQLEDELKQLESVFIDALVEKEKQVAQLLTPS